MLAGKWISPACSIADVDFSNGSVRCLWRVKRNHFTASGVGKQKVIEQLYVSSVGIDDGKLTGSKYLESGELLTRDCTPIGLCSYSHNLSFACYYLLPVPPLAEFLHNRRVVCFRRCFVDVREIFQQEFAPAKCEPF